MPFTPTHILATLPLARSWTGSGVFPALVIGSMVPDWPLYVPVGPDYVLTHSFVGVIVACFPLGLALSVLFIRYLRRPLFELAPPGLQQRLTRYLDEPSDLSVRSLLQLSAAVCVGATTHVVWDAFTHGAMWGVALIPSLKQVWVSVLGVRFPGYLVLQHGSSLIGLPLLLLIFVFWYRRSEPLETTNIIVSQAVRRSWLASMTGIPLGILIWHIAHVPQEGLRPVLLALYYGVTDAGLLLMILVACYGLLFYPAIRHQRKHR